MTDLAEVLNRLEIKARKLRQTISDLEIEVKKCNARNEEQEAKILLYKQKINDLTNRNQLLKVSSELSRADSAKRNPAAKKVVDNLIGEIDCCITLLDR